MKSLHFRIFPFFPSGDGSGQTILTGGACDSLQLLGS